MNCKNRRINYNDTLNSSYLIGFDNILNQLESLSSKPVNNYPPYNLAQRSEDEYVIELACSGFDQDDIEITQDNNVLVIKGTKEKPEEENYKYIHNGLAFRTFTKEFRLADYMEVEKASIKNGILYINIERNIPEQLKPKKIKIN